MIMQKNLRLFAIGTAVSLLCVFGLLKLIEPAQIWQAVQQARLQPLLVGGLAILSYMSFRAVRWRYLLSNQIPYQDVFHAQNVGYLLTQILPFRIGDITRAIMVGQRNNQVSVPLGLSTMAIERILDMLLMVLILPLALLQTNQLPGWMIRTAWLSGGLGMGTVIFLTFMAKKRPHVRKVVTAVLQKVSVGKAAIWMARTDAFLNGLTVFTKWQSAGMAIGLTIIVWIPIVWAYTAVMHAFDLPISISVAVYLMCAGAFSVAAPTSPGQIGVFHAGITAAMALIGVPAPIAAGYAIVYHALNFVIMVLLGIVSLFFVPWPWKNRSLSRRELKSSVSFIKKPIKL
jgi:glycosyltransferase 2 family protein